MGARPEAGENSRYKLTWQQLVWAGGVLLALSAAWWDLSANQQQIAAEVTDLSKRITKLEATIDNNIIPRREAELQQREIDRRIDRLERR